MMLWSVVHHRRREIRMVRKLCERNNVLHCRLCRYVRDVPRMRYWYLILLVSQILGYALLGGINKSTQCESHALTGKSTTGK